MRQILLAILGSKIMVYVVLLIIIAGLWHIARKLDVLD
jgi:hypothetical protein